MMDACEQHPGCIAYNGISYLSQALASNKLGYASLMNNAGAFTLPTAAAIQAAVRQLRVAHAAQRDDRR